VSGVDRAFGPFAGDEKQATHHVDLALLV